MRISHIACFACLGFTLSYGLTPGMQNVQRFQVDALLPKAQKTSTTLKDLIQSAEKNYQILAKDDGIAKVKAEKMSAYLEFGPTITASYNYGYQTNPSSSRPSYVGDQNLSVGINYDLYTGFTSINKVKQKNAEINASVADKKFTQESLYLQIIQQYYAYFTYYSNLQSLKQKKTLLISNVQRLQKLYNSGLSTINDVEALRAEASLTEYQIAQAELDVEQSRLNLELLANKEVKSLARVVLKDPQLKVSKTRSDILALDAQAQSIDFQKRQITYAPTISFYDKFGYNPDGLSVTGSEKIQNTVGISITMQFDSMSRYMQKEALGLSYLQATKNIAYKKEEQKKDIKLYRKSLEIARAKVKSAEAGLKSAMIAFDNISKQYDAQLVTYVDYLNALSQKFTAEATYIESLNNYEVQKANFVFYSGQDLKQYI
ncbi:TolC family protein [Helicobacter cholecystus]|uniref:TolC family protein n=1 Tax=Helicobacter cholecystus TaxID=45498 RepID=A0A3D8IX16_9HELI|nr:TolC family protein [Helicobacter cholecystus]RDU69506.1 TolC family protein [Helicobacter cholecystus]VEJ24059.1 outer membrane efflux protein [Helicobacter cholecystus]